MKLLCCWFLVFKSNWLLVGDSWISLFCKPNVSSRKDVNKILPSSFAESVIVYLLTSVQFEVAWSFFFLQNVSFFGVCISFCTRKQHLDLKENINNDNEYNRGIYRPRRTHSWLEQRNLAGMHYVEMDVTSMQCMLIQFLMFISEWTVETFTRNIPHLFTRNAYLVVGVRNPWVTTCCWGILFLNYIAGLLCD